MRKRMCGAFLPIIATIIMVAGCNGDKHALVSNGTIEADEVRVTAEVGGTVRELRVNEGDRVRAGQVVAVLSSDTLLSQVNQALAGLEASRAALAEAQGGSREQEIAAAQQECHRLEALVKVSEQDLSLAENTLGKYRQLYAEGAMSEQEFSVQSAATEKARAQYEAAKAALEAARAKLALLREGASAETLQRLQAQVKASSAGAKEAQAYLDKTTLRAPTDGTVISCNFKVGEVVRPGAEVITLMDPRQLWLDAFVPEDRIGEVRVGQSVEVRVDGITDKTFSGRVTFISPTTEFTPRNVQTREDRVRLVFRVKIKLDEGQDELRPGMPADVIFTNQG